MLGTVRMYTDLAPWFHLLTHPSDYREEAEFVTRVVDELVDGPAETLLELGSGGGNNASHLKERFTCTLTDLSPQMLELSAAVNPECEHLVGDMRTLRLGRTFDVVFVHDAVSYLTTENDLRAAIGTAATHVRPGGAVVLTPDATTEMFKPGTEHGGHDGEDGRSLRYLEWTHPVTPGSSSYDVDYVIALRTPGEPFEIVHDTHTLGVFPWATWRRLLDEAGLAVVDVKVANPFAHEQEVFAARRPSSA
jgi:SAM-dependent methyltransferase